MINRQELLRDLQRLLRQLETDLRQRCDEPEIGAAVRAEYDAAKDAERTGQSFEEWRADTITQIAAAWVLSCVFVRFLEDNDLVDPPRLAGPGERLQRARDEYDLYVHRYPSHTVREYLLSVFDRLAELPGGRDVFGGDNLIHQQRHWLSGDAAKELRNFWQRIDPKSGDLVHDFTDPQWDTRFLGDLYQDLSEAARKKYALLQTPVFVEEFILDRTLEPALDEFGLVVSGQLSVVSRQSSVVSGKKTTDNCQLPTDVFKMIDPACGSGHFLLGSFDRILRRWRKKEPGANAADLVQRTLHSIHGVDVNPYAVAIARFRLLLAALQACGLARLADAPGFEMNLACGDSLYHGRQVQRMLAGVETDESHYFRAEDPEALRRMLREGTYHCVVANPPYITPKDRAANDAYRKLYPKTCHRQYSLAVPFMERIFRLAVGSRQLAVGSGEETTDTGAAGFVGQITANSFMKREFGKKLIEQFLPTVDLTHVIDTSGAYLPGHGTPTVILFGRNRKPVGGTIRTVMGIRGEPSTPEDPSRGRVWSAIVEQINQPGSQSEFVSVGDSSPELFQKHPWSIGGGGAAELKEEMEARSGHTLGDYCAEIGFGAITREDEAYLIGTKTALRYGVPSHQVRPLVEGDDVRDWMICEPKGAIWPYSSDTLMAEGLLPVLKNLWPMRTRLSDRVAYGLTQLARGLQWFEYSMFFEKRFRTPFSIVVAFVATHNHFAFDRGGKVFKQSAPVIKLPPDATPDEHLAILGVLNSSVACFWMKQAFHNKGSSVDQKGARQTTVAFENFWEHDGTKLKQFPLPEHRPLELAQHLDQLARELQATTPGEVLTRRREGAKGEALGDELSAFAPLRETLSAAHAHYERIRGLMIFLQEELDWACYRLYGLLDDDLTYRGEPFPLAFGQRSFEILLAQRMASQTAQPTTWFERHNAQPLTAPPEHWPDDYLALYHRRYEIQQKNPNLGLIEQPEYKRRWNSEPWESQVARALKNGLLDRLESYFDLDGRMNDEGQITAHASLSEPCLVSTAQLADIAARDAAFMEVAEVYRDRRDFDLARLVAELVADESVPLLPVLRYKPAGMDKRQAWQHTWELQRQEDEGGGQWSVVSGQLKEVSGPLAVGSGQLAVAGGERTIPVPPKYKSSDFQSSAYWRLRGKLDVPKERWGSFPYCEGEDQSLVVAWAGYDHLQMAKAISAHFAEVQERGGAEEPRLVPLLGCLLELVPWLKQWHNDLDPEFGYRLGDYFESFVEEETRTLGMTVSDVRRWQPPKKTTKRKTSKR